MIKTMKTICLVCLILMFSVSAYAETYLFVGSSYSLLSEKGEDGEFRGIAVDLAKTITETLGHTIKIELYPWKRAQNMVKTGNADVLMAPFKTPEREKWLDFSEIPFATNYTFLFAKPGNSFVWNGDFSSLKGKKIGMSLGWALGAEFEKAKSFLSIDYASNIDSCFKKLLSSRVDLVPTQLQEAIASFQRLGLSDDQMPIKIFPAMAENHQYFGFSKQNKLSEFKTNFDRKMKQMKNSGELSQLLAKYGWQVL